LDEGYGKPEKNPAWARPAAIPGWGDGNVGEGYAPW